MAKVVGVRSQPLGKLLYCDVGEVTLNTGDYVVLNTNHGLELAKVIIPEVKDEFVSSNEPLISVVRRAQREDLEIAHQSNEIEALVKCREAAAKLGLKMKPLSAHYNLDGSHLTIYFSAQERVDFRGLVRKLRQSLKAKVKLSQVKSRDTARLLGGIGKCGCPLCCQRFLIDFPQVSVRMAKEQGLPLTPDKITGICGRTLCCLLYENQEYLDIKTKMPRAGQEVSTPLGKAKVLSINPVKETVLVGLEDQNIKEMPLRQLNWGEN